MPYRSFLCRLAVLALCLSFSSCNFGSALKLRNETGMVLIPYPVVTDPPPPHREADPGNEIVPLDDGDLDPDGFNPVFYQQGVSDPGKANGVFLGFDLFDADPLLIQFKVFHYKVPPGQEGTDPANQPVLLHQGVQEVEDRDLTVLVTSKIVLGQTLPPGGWRVSFVKK